jgi:hypothetical protein
MHKSLLIVAMLLYASAAIQHYPFSTLTNGDKTKDNIHAVKKELQLRGWSLFHWDTSSRDYFEIDNVTIPRSFHFFKKWMQSTQRQKDLWRHVKYPENRFGLKRWTRWIMMSCKNNICGEQNIQVQHSCS